MGEGPGETHKGLSVSVGGSRTEEVLTKLPETRTMEKALIDCVDVEQQLGLSLFSKGDVTGLWLVGGDFNEIIAMHEYLGRRFRVMSQIRDFGATLEDCGLSTVGFKGYKFTWSNRWRGGGNVKLSLDRMVANDLMFLAFPDMLTHHLNSVVLDHLPIFMGLGCIVGQGGSNALCSRNFEPQLKTNGTTDNSHIIEVVQPAVMLEHNESLNFPFPRDEVEGSLNQMFPTKSLGVDAMPALFYQKYWDVVGNDVVAFCLNIMNGRASVKEVNHTLLTPIPKVHRPTKVTGFRPINLCTVLYKIISKSMVNRLKLIMPFIISEYQSVFVPSRLITNNIITAFESIRAI
ncbi:hypothetical protein GBA52_020310 [Prunus armeniaca]|nr:hypothetical protein GBA52_020310 [Prunus armeniaca]